jgi:DNA invertase Pin-like site-specific DNA recombinase
MPKDATRCRFNVVMVWAMDRLGRSVSDLIDTLRSLEAANVATPGSPGHAHVA